MREKAPAVPARLCLGVRGRDSLISSLGWTDQLPVDATESFSTISVPEYELRMSCNAQSMSGWMIPGTDLSTIIHRNRAAWINLVMIVFSIDPESLVST